MSIISNIDESCIGYEYCVDNECTCEDGCPRQEIEDDILDAYEEYAS